MKNEIKKNETVDLMEGNMEKNGREPEGKIMKVKLKDLHPNPYKRMINKGKLSQNQIDKLKANLKELGHMGSVPVVRINNRFHTVSHHHRIEALKQLFDENYEVEIDLKNYSDSQLFKGMIIENLTQRNGELREEMENCIATETFLNNNPEELKRLRASRKRSKRYGMKEDYKNKATNKDIAFWLDPNGKIISHDSVRDLCSMAKNLCPALLEKVKKKKLTTTLAVNLSKIKEEEEQKDLAKALKDCREETVKQKSKLLNKYKSAEDDVKKSIRDGEVNLADVEKHMKVGTTFIPDFTMRFEHTKENALKLEKQASEFTNIFMDKRFTEQYERLKPEQKKDFNKGFLSTWSSIEECYEKMERLMSKLPDKGLLEKGEETKLIDKIEKMDKMIVHIKDDYLYAINKNHSLLLRFKLNKSYPEMCFATRKWEKGAKFYQDINGEFCVNKKEIILSLKNAKITIPRENVNLEKEFDELKSDCIESLFELSAPIYKFVYKYQDKAPFFKICLKGKQARVVLYDTSEDQTVETTINLNKIQKPAEYYMPTSDVCTLYGVGFISSEFLISKDTNYFLIKEGKMEALLGSMKIET